MIKYTLISGYYWLGGTLGSLNQFYWIDGTRLDQAYTNWSDGEKADHDGVLGDGSENRLALRLVDKLWGDVVHTYEQYVLCEYGSV